MKVGVTGATGALGLRLTEKLLEKNYKIKVLVRKTSKIENLDKNKVEIIYGDITDYQSLKDFIKDIDICFHIAAQVGFTSKKKFFDVNVTGTDNICKAIIEYNPDCRLMHCSTISTLKINPFFTIKSSNYGVSKYYGEKKVLEHIKKNNLKATIIYPGIIYGPHDKTVIPPVLQLLKYNLIRLTKGGEDCAPIIYVDELCDLFINAALNKKAIGKRYISVKGADIGIHEFIRMIAQKMNLPIPKKIYNKKLMFIKALYLELLYKLMGKKEKPPIYRTLVNIFSINFKSYKKRYNDPLVDLGWTQSTSREFIDKTLDISLDWIKKSTI
jgi:nucleoside-diphosphate-sugar epimerase